MKKKLIITILFTGFSGLVCQILLLREFLIVFLGNELSIGIILSNWLILEAAGAYLAGKIIEKTAKKIESFSIFLLIFSLFLPLSVYLIRILKNILGAVPGEALGLDTIFYSSFLILLGLSFSHGALFTISCKVFSQKSSRDVRVTSVGKVYILETLGTIAGGVALTYLFIPFFDSFKISFFLSLANCILVLLLTGIFWKKNFYQKILGLVSLALIVLYGTIFAFGLQDIHTISVAAQWPNQEVLYYQNSIYGNVAVTKREEQFTFFSNGVPVFSSPTPDVAWVEEFAHFALLSHSLPEDVLILSGGVGGLIHEILKHPSIKKIDYAELDPLLLRAVEDFPTSLTEAELDSPKVSTQFTDGRFFVKTTPNMYDVIFVGVSLPLDLQLNRLFTVEFFKEASHKLKPDGLLVISLPGSLAYLSKELKSINSSILNTLGQIYPYIKIIPGDGKNIYIASNSFYILDVTNMLLYQRLQERGIQSRLLTSGYFEYRMSERWLDWFNQSISNVKSKINYDFKPSGLLYTLSFFSASFSPGVNAVLAGLENLNLNMIFIIIFIFTLLLLIAASRFKKLFNLSIPYCIATSGFVGMMFDLALIFCFQVMYGYVFYWIGILVSIFMLGAVVGGLISTLALKKNKRDRVIFIRLELVIIIFSLLTPFVFLKLQPFVAKGAMHFIVQSVFLIIAFISGLVTAVEFPLANKIYLGSTNNFKVGKTAGLLYSLDLLGGWLGGILGAVVFLPILGLQNTFFLLVFIKLSSLIFLIVSGKAAQKV